VPLVTGAAALYLPHEMLPVATMLAFPLARAATAMLGAAARLPVGAQLRRLIGVQPQRSIILEADNALYSKFEAYLVKHHLDRFLDCQLEPRRGDIAFTINNALLLGPIEIEHEGLRITIALNVRPRGGDDDKQRVRGKDGGLAGTGLRLTSSGSLERLRDFVARVCQRQEREQSQLLRIYYSASKGKKKDGSKPYWEELEVVTNRNLANTIIDASVRTALVDDVRWFLGAQAWYNDKGIPYKRGYLLHGPPGTGKSSILKALAVEYDLPVFAVDMATVKSNNDLKALITEIAYLSRGQRYILSLEDIDRAEMFDRYGSRKVTVDCLLNVLDGLAESYGRLLFLSANDTAPLQAVPALLRPGRVDRVVEVTYVTASQFCAMLQHFYQQPFSVAAVPPALSPAQVINVLQQCPDAPDRALELLLASGARAGAGAGASALCVAGAESLPPLRRAALRGRGRGARRSQTRTPLARKQLALRQVERRLATEATRQERQRQRDITRQAKLRAQVERLAARDAALKAKAKAKAAKDKERARAKAAKEKAKAAKAKAAKPKAARPKAARPKAALASTTESRLSFESEGSIRDENSPRA
jgi:hypothetical protein